MVKSKSSAQSRSAQPSSTEVASTQRSTPQVFRCRLRLSQKTGQLKLGDDPAFFVGVAADEFVVCMDRKTLAALETGQFDRVRVPRELLATLRQYAFWHGGQRGLAQAGLTFCCCYAESPESCQQILKTPDRCDRIARTIVSLDGDVLHQIRQDKLPELTENNILLAYYWFVRQLLAELRASAAEYIEKRWGLALEWLSWTPFLCTVMQRAADFWHQMATGLAMVVQQWLVDWLIATVGWLAVGFLLKLLVRFLINRLLRFIGDWAFRQAISADPKFQQLAKRILGRFIP